MGRTYDFKPSKIQLIIPPTNLNAGNVVNIKFLFPTNATFTRSVSLYGKQPVPMADGTYIVLNNDVDDCLNDIGLRGILVEPVGLTNKGNYHHDWYITTDGCVREIEGCGIIGHAHIFGSIA